MAGSSGSSGYINDNNNDIDDDNDEEGARGGAVVTALASRDKRLRVRSRTLPCVSHPVTVTSPEVGGPNGETAFDPPKRIC